MSGDLWRTPKEVFNTLNNEFNFIADMASSDHNKLCRVGFTEDHDSLSFNWREKIDTLSPYPNQYVWLNCPYSNPMPWVEKALESQKDGLGVVMLLNADTSVGWFAEALKGVSEIRNIVGDKKQGKGYSSGRLSFIGTNDKPIAGNNKPQFILVFNPFKIGARVTTYITKKELYGSLKGE